MNFIDIKDITINDFHHIMDLATKYRHNVSSKPLADKHLAMIFTKASTRTRVSFEVGMNQLGGSSVVLRGDEMQLGRGETIGDTAQVLSRFVDMVMIRTYDHEDIVELAKFAQIPVINGLSDRSHPCQIMADLLTLQQHKGDLRQCKVAWLGDGNNVCRSWVQASLLAGCALSLAIPSAYNSVKDDIADAIQAGAKITYFDSGNADKDIADAVRDADCVIADCFVSMGDQDTKARLHALMPYQVNASVMAKAKKDAIFMHCLPAHRGEEVSAEVIDGAQSVVFDEAENRIHAQKAIMLWCMGY